MDQKGQEGARLLEFALPMVYPSDRESSDARNSFNERMLLRALESRKTVVILGSGISRPFGHPSWNCFAQLLLERTEKELAVIGGGPELEAIKAYKSAAETTNASLDTNALMFLIGACRSALGEERYGTFIKEQFSLAPKEPAFNPLKTLLLLPIHRFVTTNYDWEIEQALVTYRPKPDHRETQSFLQTGSFTQKAGPDRMVRFALSEIDDQEEVFHCHGRYDDLNSLVATEEDYQRLYLESSAGGPRAFQELIALLLGSNPLLFIGYSLSDEDLLRPLRQLGVLEPARKVKRPMFALIPSAENNSDALKHAAFLERFGLHVLSYPTKNLQDPTEDLCKRLEELRDTLEKEHGKRAEKSKLKPPLSPQHLPKPHCELGSVWVPAGPWPELTDSIHQPGVVLVIGPSGCAKSHHLVELIKQAESHGFEGAFYWNAHYSNETFTALDTALSYFDPKRKLSGTRNDRVRQCLKEKRFLLVIDGCERLLRRSGTAGEGTSYSATFHQLLDAVADPHNKSTVIIAGRLRPSDLRNSLHRPARTLQASRIKAQDIADHKLFVGIRPADLSALCSLLRGHAFGLRLAGEFLKLCSDPQKGIRKLICHLADQIRHDRLNAMVLLLVQALDREVPGEDLCGVQGGVGPTRAFLERLALFLSPVCAATLNLCREQDGNGGSLANQDLAGLLQKTGLLIPICQPAERGEEPAAKTYAVHMTVRSALFPGRRGVAADSLPAFGLSGFTSGRLGVNPEPDYRQSVEALFDAILCRARLARQYDRAAAGMLCRDAYSLMRTRMEANTAPRWITYEGYLRYGLEIASLVKSLSPQGRWTYCEPPDLDHFTEDKDAPLYPSELAWLYNDIALGLSASGYIVDACFFWEQAYEISRLVEDPQTGGGYHLEILLSIAFTLIERGHLGAALQYVEDAERFLRDWPDEEYRARVLGLRGLMAHLQGNLQKAADLYERCLGLLRDSDNLRAQSVFSKHLADIMITTGRFRKADMLIRNSRAQAEAGVFPELAVNARISQGHLFSRQNQFVQARLEYEAVLNEAQNIGFRKLEVRALTALARLALQQQDVDGARRLSMQSLSLANELGLGLRQSHSLVVLGLATLAAGQKDLGAAYLRLARKMAMDQQYWARCQEAENKLRELGEKLEETPDGNSKTIASNWAGA